MTCSYSLLELQMNTPMVVPLVNSQVKEESRGSNISPVNQGTVSEVTNLMYSFFVKFLIVHSLLYSYATAVAIKINPCKELQVEFTSYICTPHMCTVPYMKCKVQPPVYTLCRVKMYAVPFLGVN